jgi:hypothetical protein
MQGMNTKLEKLINLMSATTHSGVSKKATLEDVVGEVSEEVPEKKAKKTAKKKTK